jgi:hypothetical protein
MYRSVPQEQRSRGKRSQFRLCSLGGIVLKVDRHFPNRLPFDARRFRVFCSRPQVLPKCSGHFLQPKLMNPPVGVKPPIRLR